MAFFINMEGFKKLKSSEQNKTKEVWKDWVKKDVPLILLTIVFNVTFMVLIANEAISFGPLGNTRAQDLQDFQSRIGYVLKFQAPALGWLVLWMIITTTYRAIDPKEYEQNILKSKAILRNSLEQYILFICSQLMMVNYLTPTGALKLTPAITFMFMFGRIAYWLGYPNYKSFGFITSGLPTYLTTIFCLLEFIRLSLFNVKY